jgi:hypothetical protein
LNQIEEADFEVKVPNSFRDTFNDLSEHTLESGVAEAKPFYPCQVKETDTNSNQSSENDFMKNDPNAIYD